MNYVKIGEKIRKYRKAKGLSQESLAEKVGISVTHMSHIETGNTKLSLSVCVELSRALEVQVDDILFDFPKEKSKVTFEIDELLASCSSNELKVILEIIKTAKISMDKYMQ